MYIYMYMYMYICIYMYMYMHVQGSIQKILIDRGEGGGGEGGSYMADLLYVHAHDCTYMYMYLSYSILCCFAARLHDPFSFPRIARVSCTNYYYMYM